MGGPDFDVGRLDSMTLPEVVACCSSALVLDIKAGRFRVRLADSDNTLDRDALPYPPTDPFSPTE